MINPNETTIADDRREGSPGRPASFWGDVLNLSGFFLGFVGLSLAIRIASGASPVDAVVSMKTYALVVAGTIIASAALSAYLRRIGWWQS